MQQEQKKNVLKRQDRVVARYQTANPTLTNFVMLFLVGRIDLMGIKHFRVIYEIYWLQNYGI